MMKSTEIVSLFGGNPNKRTQNVTCPCHNDTEASLTITQTANKVLFHCKAGCDTKNILAAKGLTFSDLYEDTPIRSDWQIRMLNYYMKKPPIKDCIPDTLRIAAVYNYENAGGEYSYSKVRFEGDTKNGEHKKTLRYFRIDYSSNRYEFGVGDAKHTLYNLPVILDSSRKSEPVFYVEGEKDVITLSKHGLLATTAGAVKDWQTDFAKYFKDRNVVLVGDNDIPGRKSVEVIKNDIVRIASSVKVVFPSKLNHGDITDYLQKESGTIENFLKMVQDAPVEQVPEKTFLPEITSKQVIETDEPESCVPMLKVGDKGKNLSVIENYVEVLEKDHVLKDTLRYNALTGRVEVSGVPWNQKPHPVRDDDLVHYRLRISDIYGIQNRNDIRDAMLIVGQNNIFHPVVDKLKSLKWDGVDYIADLLPKYLGAEYCEYTTAVTTMLLHAAIQRVFNPGCKFDICVVLKGPQGSGKSTFCKFLALSDEWFTDDLQNLSDPKETYEIMRGHWICELGEMVSTKKTKDVETIKSFLSRQIDTYRTPYDVFPNDIPRQQIFIGTTNKESFLPNDPTGSRRFVPVILKSLPEHHPLDVEAELRAHILGAYAQALEIGRNDGWMLTLPHKFDSMLAELWEAAQPENDKPGMIQHYLDKECHTDIVCSRMIFDKKFSMNGTRTPSQFELGDIADIMNHSITGWERYAGKNGKAKTSFYRFDEYGNQRAWIRSKSVYSDGGGVDKNEGTVDKNCENGFVPIPPDEEIPF